MDHLKKINNEHGHLAGDQAIRRYLTHARAVFEKWGKLYRVGGDELAIIVCSQELSRCVALAESFLHSLQSDKMETNDRVQVPLSASIGIAISPPLSRDPQALHYEADARQIRAKERGRKCVVST